MQETRRGLVKPAISLFVSHLSLLSVVFLSSSFRPLFLCLSLFSPSSFLILRFFFLSGTFSLLLFLPPLYPILVPACGFIDPPSRSWTPVFLLSFDRLFFSLVFVLTPVRYPPVRLFVGAVGRRPDMPKRGWHQLAQEPICGPFVFSFFLSTCVPLRFVFFFFSSSSSTITSCSPTQRQGLGNPCTSFPFLLFSRSSLRRNANT